MIKLIFVTYELKRMQYVHSNTGYYTKALYFQKSPLMEKNLLLQVILHRVNFILVLRSIKIAQNPNNSYPLNKPYLRLKTVKTISHTYLISKKRRTIFSKNNKPHVWLIRKCIWEFQVGNSLLRIRINQDMPLATKVKEGWIEAQIADR